MCKFHYFKFSFLDSLFAQVPRQCHCRRRNSVVKGFFSHHLLALFCATTRKWQVHISKTIRLSYQIKSILLGRFMPSI